MNTLEITEEDVISSYLIGYWLSLQSNEEINIHNRDIYYVIVGHFVKNILH